jgi:metallo-beta-lactamase class B
VVLALAVAAGRRWPDRRQDDPVREPPAPLLEAGPVTLAPGLHLLGGLSPAAAYVVETSEGLVLIDTGLERDARPLKGEMAALALDWNRIRAIFLTHVHSDHSGGAQHLRAATGAKVYAGQGDAAILRAGGPREAFHSKFFVPHDVPGPTTVDVELRDDQLITVGDVRFRALATPGHTPGSMCYLMERGGQSVLFAGDVILSLRGRSPLGAYTAYLAPRYRGNADAFLATLRRLRALPAPALVLPGHPRHDSAPASPAMSQQRWQTLLDAGIRELEQLRARYARDGAPFLDGVVKTLLPGLCYLGEFKGVAVYALVAGSKLFLVNAPGGQGLSAFVTARLRQAGLKPAPPVAVLLTSGDPEATAGVVELVGRYHCPVVAPPGACAAIKKVCPAGTSVLSAEDLPKEGWLQVAQIPLRGRGVAPLAYLVRWGDRDVLFSGPLPVKLDQPGRHALALDFSRGRANANDCRASLRRLGELHPDLWLPAYPTNGQNARLYDNEWETTLGEWETILAANTPVSP